MKIVLRDDVDNLGQKGDVVDVADGYARNYLVPKGLAIKAENGAVRQAEAMRRNRSARELRDRDAARRLGLDEPLKELGPVELPVRLHADVVATLSIDVVAQ